MASFLSYIKQNKIPKKKTLSLMLENPYSWYSLILYGLLLALFVVIYITLYKLNDRLVVVIPKSGGVLVEGTVGSIELGEIRNGLFDNTSPFIISDQTTNRIDLARNKGFSGKRPLLKTLTIKSFPTEGALLKALQAGDVDFTFALDPEHTKELSTKKFLSYKIVANKNISIFQSINDTALKDAKLVSIIDSYIDRKKIVDTIEFGYGLPSKDGNQTLEETLSNLKKIGYTYQDGTLFKVLNKKSIQKISFDIAVENSDKMLALAKILEEQFGTLGIGVTIKAYDHGAFVDGVRANEYQIFLSSTSRDIPNSDKEIFKLYTQTAPLITNQKTHIDINADLASIETRYSASQYWYARTQSVWKLFKTINNRN